MSDRPTLASRTKWFLLCAGLSLALLLTATGVAWAQKKDQSAVGALALAALALPVCAGAVGLALLTTIILPRFSLRTVTAARSHAWASFLWGLCLAVLTIVLIAIFTQAGDLGGLLAVLMAATVLGAAVVGFGGVAWRVGERMLEGAQSARTGQPTFCVLVGAATLFGAGLLPVFGQIAGLITALVSLGACAQALFHGQALDREAQLGSSLPTVPQRPQAPAAQPPSPPAPPTEPPTPPQ